MPERFKNPQLEQALPTGPLASLDDDIVRGFDQSTLPWVDRPDFQAVLQERVRRGELKDDAANLNFWQQNGFLHLPGMIDPADLDEFWSDVDEAWVERPSVELLFGPEGGNHGVLSEMKGRLNRHYRFLNFHLFSRRCLELALHPRIVEMLAVLFDATPVLMQTLTYEFSSEQSMHVDYIPVRASIPSHLIASWIACEDVTPDAGALVYYPGSHRIDPAGIDDGRLAEFFPKGEGIPWPAYLMAKCMEMKLERRELLARKGDVFFWHAALVHGGSGIKRPGATRKSLVCHYSTPKGYPRCRYYANTHLEGVGKGAYFKVGA